MRVLHVAESLPGGISTYLHEMLPYQCRRLGSDQIYVLVPENHAHHLPSNATCQVLTYRRKGRDLLSLLRLLMAVLSATRITRPDLIHAHSTYAGAVVRLCSLLLWRRPKIIYCAHGWAFLRDVAPWKNSAVAFVERILAYFTDGISSITNIEHEAALRVGIRSRVIRYGVSAASPTGTPALVVDPGCMNFFFIGRHDMQKGLDILIEAFRHLPPKNFRLYVAGASVLRDAVQPSHEQPPNVEFIGWIKHADIDTHIRLFDALLVPSRWEGFGLVVLEAMRNSVAVIASNRGSLPEVVEDGISGIIFDLGQPGALAQLLLSTDRTTLRRYGAAGFERYSKEFNSERMCRETLELYADTLHLPHIAHDETA